MNEPHIDVTRARMLNVPFLSRLMVAKHDTARPAATPSMTKAAPAASAHKPLARRLGRRDAASGYRADIDGLRAIAVLAVILVHAGVRSVGGGFLGVDVFFVISGYLVHQQVMSRLETGSFSLFGFYGRRIRRTFPALYLIAGVSLVAGAVLLMPGDFDALARSAIAAGLGASNILFAMQTGYFDHDAITKPLLHSWSLGVEEQFYLVAPIVPFAIRRFSAVTRRSILIGLCVLDLAFCVVVQRLIPDITFFMMPPRLWEFLLGSLVAEGMLPSLKRQWLYELAAAAALAGLLFALASLSRANAHPGLATLLPCLATALLIQIGGTTSTLTHRLLGLAPLALCGLISYSLYLWHWPLIVFARYADLPLDFGNCAIGAGLLCILSILSWKYVETPFRDPVSPLRRHAVPILLTALCCLAATSSLVIAGHGLPKRFSPEVAAVTSYYDYADRRDYRDGSCFVTSKYNDARYFDRNTCLQTSAMQPNYLLIGDSHAAHLWTGLSRAFPKIHLLQATASGCKPVLGTHGLGYCVDLMHEALVDFLPSAKLDGVIFAAAWNDADLVPLQATLAYAQKYVPKVIVIGDIASHEIDLPNLLGRSIIAHRPELIIENQSPWPWHWDRLYKAGIAPENYVSLVDLMCPEHRCIVYAAPDVPLQFDTSHLTSEGSLFVAKRMAELPIFAPLVDGRPMRSGQ
jgi:peptidoglycan/LPS O-acetylase OafA/YrhL